MSIKSRLQRLEQAVGTSIPSVAMIDPEAARAARIRSPRAALG